MKRSGFKSKAPPPRPVKTIEYTPRPRAIARSTGVATMGVAVPKREPIRSEAYRRLVAAMDCAMCGHPGPSQAAHADFGKGMGTKSDDRTCFPLCATTSYHKGCHDLVGASGVLGKIGRRNLELRLGRETRTKIIEAGLWPKSLPAWPEDISCVSDA